MLGELVLVWIRFTLDLSLAMVVGSPIYRGPGPLPKYCAGRDPTLAKFDGTTSTSDPD